VLDIARKHINPKRRHDPQYKTWRPLEYRILKAKRKVNRMWLVEFVACRINTLRIPYGLAAQRIKMLFCEVHFYFVLFCFVFLFWSLELAGFFSLFRLNCFLFLEKRKLSRVVIGYILKWFESFLLICLALIFVCVFAWSFFLFFILFVMEIAYNISSYNILYLYLKVKRRN
jgi:hypothetical protein